MSSYLFPKGAERVENIKILNSTTFLSKPKLCAEINDSFSSAKKTALTKMVRKFHSFAEHFGKPQR